MNETTTEIKSIFTPFYEIIEEVRVNELRKEFLREQIKLPFEFHAKCSSTIEANSSLEPAEKEQWKKIYEKVSSWTGLITSCLEEKNFLVSLAKKYKDKEEQSQRDNIPKCKKCQLRRERTHKFPVGCEDWCKECINKKQREEQSPKDNNNNYTPLVNDNPNDDNTPSQDEPPTHSDKNSSNGNDVSSNTPTKDDNEKRDNNNGSPTDKDNSSNSRKQSKDDSATSQNQQIVKYSFLIIIPAFGVSLIVYFLAKKKKKQESNKVF